jgi:hypothetical protein
MFQYSSEGESESRKLAVQANNFTHQFGESFLKNRLVKVREVFVSKTEFEVGGFGHELVLFQEAFSVFGGDLKRAPRKDDRNETIAKLNHSNLLECLLSVYARFELKSRIILDPKFGGWR